MLQCCVCRRLSSVCSVCIVAKRCVLEHKLLLTEVIYQEAIGTNINDLDLWLEVVWRSCRPLRHIRHWISWKPLEIEDWFQRTTNRKLPTGNQMVTWPMTPRDSERCCEAVRSAILATAWLLVTADEWWNGFSRHVPCHAAVQTHYTLHTIHHCRSSRWQMRLIHQVSFVVQSIT